MSDILENLAKAVKKKKEKDRGIPDGTGSYRGQSGRGVGPGRGRNKVSGCGAASPFVKASGPGGVIFDFGNRSGNAFVDNYNRLMNRYADPQQKQIIRDQEVAHQKALSRFVEVGERQYEVEKGQGNDLSAINQAWNKELSKSTDDHIKKLYEEGKLCVEDPGAIEKSGAKDHPQFSQTQISMGGETVKAASETDQAVIEMMKSGQNEEE